MTPLISPQDLLPRVGDRALAVIDVRWSLTGPPGIDDFLAGHIPGAHFVDLDRELASPPGTGGRHPLPDPVDVGVTLRRCGVDAETFVVVYDAGSSMAAARAWWVLRDVGVAQVAVLDGGLSAWTQMGGPIELGPQEAAHGTFEPSAGRLPRLDAGAAAWVAVNGVLLDARAPERYRGEAEPVDPVAGHIPGAVNRPTTDLLTAAGTFRPAHELREMFAEHGIDDETLVGTYCGSGVTAAHLLLGLTVAGFDGSLYPGSWSEWIVDPARPIAVGDE